MLSGYKTYIAGGVSILYGIAVFLGWFGDASGFDAAMPYLVTGFGLVGLGHKFEKLLDFFKKK